MHPLKIFVIAGEASGDLLGGAILDAIARHSGRPLHIMGIGGDAIKGVGMKTSLFPMYELSVMGIVEIIPKIPHFISLINRTVDAIEGFKPEMVITIDSPDFCFRVQKKIRTRGRLRGAKQFHVVAPSVWAWRENRAQKIAQFLDGLVCFFPFEPPYFERHGLRAVAIGHPAINGPVATTDPSQLKKTLDLHADEKILGLYLGSRAGVIERHTPIYIQAVNILAQTHPHVRVLIPTFPTYADRLRAIGNNLVLQHHVITDQSLKPMAMKACNVALAVSGTVGLELAIADVPHVVGYRVSKLTWWISRFLIKPGQMAHLANIVLGRRLVPELIQDDCTPERLAKEVARLLDSDLAADVQRQGFAKVRIAIGEGSEEKPADKAAMFILNK